MKALIKTMIGLSAAGAAYVLYLKSHDEKTVESPARIHGFVSSGYEAVREAFAENFTKRHEVGAACCVYHKGEKVVDLWGGIRNKSTGEPWEEDTMALAGSCVTSTTKKLL